MLNRYELEVTARCPNNKRKRDVYRVIIESYAMIECEVIVRYCAQFKDLVLFQEELTRRLHNNFRVPVTTIGKHLNVTTTCIAE